MRTEMTVGIDLKSLENLRIVNGYGDVKKERKLSFEAPSSPEEGKVKYESDSGYQEVSSSSVATNSRPKPKCGRPANPIPRHKRDSHIKAEYKRRDKIQKGFDSLMSLVPELCDSTSGKESRSSMLFKSAEYCRRLKSECGSAQTEIAALREELETLGTEIHDLQELLPQHGTREVEQNTLSMDAMYNQYVEQETKKDWKFWVFGFFMRPLYDSYKETVSGCEKPEHFNQTLLEWVQNRMSLKSLRKGFLDSLRYISKHTGIMTNPENLHHEAQARIQDHFLKPQTDTLAITNVRSLAPSTPQQQPPSPSTSTVPQSPRVITPVGTPRVVTPVPRSRHPSVSGTPKGCTPIPTPSSSPPRTPVVGRRSLKRDSVRSTESRSRSNSPEAAEQKNKKRSNYRSRSGKRSPTSSVSDGEKSGFLPSPQAGLPFNTYIQSGRHCTLPHQPNLQVMMSEASSVMESQHVDRTMSSQTPTVADKVINNFIVSLFNVVKPETEPPTYDSIVRRPCPVQATSTTPMTVENGHNNTYANTTGNSYLSSASTFTKPHTTQFQQSNLDSCRQNFVPLDKSTVISEGVAMNVDNTISSTSNYHDSLISGMLSMDTEYSNSSPLTELRDYTCTTSGSTKVQDNDEVFQSLAGSNDMGCSLTSTVSSEAGARNTGLAMNTDEDSLTHFLKMDVMDMTAVMEFLKPEDPIH